MENTTQVHWAELSEPRGFQDLAAIFQGTELPPHPALFPHIRPDVTGVLLLGAQCSS